MYYFHTALIDSTIYLLQPTQNTGRDEVLEISKTYTGTLKDIAHPLIKFDITELSSSIVSGEVTASSAELILRECEASEIPALYTIYAHPISQSWDMGIGTKYDDISTENVTWNSRKTNINWVVPTGSFTYPVESTGSVSSSLWGDNGAGGTWYTNYEVTQSFEYESIDLNLNVLEPINEWLSGSIPNEGWLLKLSDEFESNTTDYGSLKYFSKETNTIYQPKIRVGWDDSSFATGSLPELVADEIKVTFKSLKKIYKVDSTPKIRVFGREKYPLRTYTDSYSYNDITYLPETTYYQIKDSITHDIIIPFSDYSKISCDEIGNYFNLNLKNWNTNREYYIEIKVNRSGVVEYFSDTNLTFTVEK